MAAEDGTSSRGGGHGGDAKRKRSPIVRVLRVVVVGIASLFALYVVGINLFLSTSLFEKIVDADPETIDIHFERGWSIVPRHIHAKKLSVRARDSNVEWRLTLDEAEFDVSFASFLKQRFAASNVHGKGLTFRMRQRLDAPPSSPEEVAGLPPIEGLPPYSVRPPKKPSPELWNDADYHLWTAHLEGIVADDVRELWIDNARFEGSARIEGRFYLKPLRAVEVGPMHITAFRGHVSTPKGVVAEAFDGSVLDVTVPRFDPRPGARGDLLHKISLACDAHLSLPELAGPFPVGLSIHGPVEVRRAEVHVAAGRLEKNSHLAVVMPNVVMTSAKHRVTGALALEADVAPAPVDGRDRLTFRAEVTGLKASRTGNAKGELPLIHASKVVATGDSSELDLAHPFGDLHVLVELPDGDVANARELSHYIPATVPASLADGRARAHLRFEAWLAEKRATASGELRAEDLDFRLAKMRVRGAAAIRAEFASYQFDTRRLEGASLVLKLADGTLASTTAPDTPLVHLNAAELSARGAVVDLDDPLRALDVAISVPSADIVSQGLLHAYLPKGSEMQVASSQSRFSLNVNLAIAHHLARGALDIQCPELMLAYRDFRIDAQVRSRVRVRDWRWEKGDLALDDARIEVDNVRLSKVGAGGTAAAPAMSIARIGVGAKSTRFGIEDPLAKVNLSAFFVDARVHDFSAINAFLPEKATFRLEGEKGAFNAKLDLDVEEHIAKGSVQARASNMGAGNEKMHLLGDVGLYADFAKWDLRRNTMTLLGSFAELTHASARFVAEGPPALTLERLFVATSTPTFDLAHPRLKGADFHLVVEGGELPDARVLSPMLPADSVVGIESGATHVAADVTVSDSRRAAAGDIEIAVKRAGVRLHTTHLSGDVRFLARVSGFDPDREELDLSGTHLEMRDMAVTGSSAATSHWQGDVALSHASLRMAPEVMFDGVVGFEASNVRPLLAIVFGNDLSKFVVGLVDMPRLVASTRIIAGTHELAFLDLDARGGDVVLRGSYAVHDRRRLGGIVAKKAFVSVGLRIDDGGAHVRFFGLEGWLRQRRCAVAEFLEVASAACPSTAPVSASKANPNPKAESKAKSR